MLPLAVWSYLDVVPILSPQPCSKACLDLGYGLSPWDVSLDPTSSTVHHQTGQLKAGREGKWGFSLKNNGVLPPSVCPERAVKAGRNPTHLLPTQEGWSWKFLDEAPAPKLSLDGFCSHSGGQRDLPGSVALLWAQC